MSGNIFDQSSYQQEQLNPVPNDSNQRSGLVGFIAATATLAFLAAVAPVYIHILVKIATWSWNLI